MVARTVLYIGNRNYSSWSLRAWLGLRFMGMDFDSERLPLDTPEFHDRIRSISAASRVPVLHVGDRVVWDSLAICEYAAERARRGSWPEDERLRTHARCSVAEMHSGFGALRSARPMNIRARRQVNLSAAVERDIERMVGLWCEALTLHTGASGWLYGERSIADAFFAPVLLRFLTYGVPVPELCQPWMQQLLEDADLQAWCVEALEETEIVEADEAGESLEVEA
ncbi:MAG: glutathione S-transferase family protein [Gammaproteobacteria bacterium]|nr:MAG: glutathione S-transferase family protein [Gammaproteobacteria bacterium]